jgi:uncharacterized protein YcaQ
VEQGADAGAVAEALGAELRRLTEWLGLEKVAPAERGDLAGALSAAL